MSFLDRLRQRSSESDPMQAATVMTVAQLRERNRKFIIFMQHKVQELEAALGDYQQHESEMAPADEEDDLSWVEPDAKIAETKSEVKEEDDLWPESATAPEVEAMSFEAGPADETDDPGWTKSALLSQPPVQPVEAPKIEDWMSLMGVTGTDQTTIAAVPSDTDNNLNGTTRAIEAERVHPVDEPAILETAGKDKTQNGDEPALMPALAGPGDVVESIGFGGIQDLHIHPEAE